jgi:hypothetical protein
MSGINLAAAGEEGDSYTFQYTMTMPEVAGDTLIKNTITATWQQTTETATETVLVKDVVLTWRSQDSLCTEVFQGDEGDVHDQDQNTGNQPLSGIQVTDALLGYDSALPTPLDPIPSARCSPRGVVGAAQEDHGRAGDIHQHGEG